MLKKIFALSFLLMAGISSLQAFIVISNINQPIKIGYPNLSQSSINATVQPHGTFQLSGKSSFEAQISGCQIFPFKNLTDLHEITFSMDDNNLVILQKYDGEMERIWFHEIGII